MKQPKLLGFLLIKSVICSVVTPLGEKGLAAPGWLNADLLKPMQRLKGNPGLNLSLIDKLYPSRI